jgi:hypothetical protein
MRKNKIVFNCILTNKPDIHFRRKLAPTKVLLLGQEIDKIDWAEPENEVDEEIMATVRIHLLFIGRTLFGLVDFY